MTLAQTIFYVVSPLVTLLAVFIAYLALVKQSRPHILVQYRPNSDIPSMIDLVIENLGGGMARNVTFSQPIPAKCYGIEKASGDCTEVLGDGLPAIAAAQKYVFDGGQYGGLADKLEGKLELDISYKYKNPIGITLKRKEVCVLSVSHMKNMPSRTSAKQAIVDALKGPNITTLQKIEKELNTIGIILSKVAEKKESSTGIMNSSLGPIIPTAFSSDMDFKDFLENHCEFYNEGTSRKVYFIKDTDCVLKVAIKNENNICNWTEIAAYHGLDDKHSLACVLSWSNSGKYLVMEKLDMTKNSPTSFIWPSWVTDRKQSNIGADKDGNPKLCDFAFTKSTNSSIASSFA